MIKRLLCLFLGLWLAVSVPLSAFATEEETPTEPEPVLTYLTIASVEAFLDFSQRCRLDSYSQNLVVTLEADLYLSDTDFQGIPIFSGRFNGNGHTISGLSVRSSGSVQGLFRYLTATALVTDLTVIGTVLPQGSQNAAGGIAGQNAGILQNCHFSGIVSGSEKIGGLVGVNTVTGIIDSCTSAGQIYGSHFVGGICGENMGVIRRSVNHAQVNTTPQQNSVDLSDITMETLTDSESAGTVTDIGGIAGTSGGLIRDCDNMAAIGYRQMGYNIGGIAGSQMGYIAGCRNFGSISGRKEVGGIVGQMEPVTNITYTTDTLQILQSQLGAMGALANQATANAQSSAAAVTGQVAAMQNHAQNAQDAVEQLLPSNGTLPDSDTLLAAQNTLNSSFSGIQSSMSSIAATTQAAASTLSQDLQAISNQVSAMGSTLSNASENLGGTITDISDADTPENLTGKVTLCINYGTILADLNAGGIAGAIAPENDLDPDADVDFSGDFSLNFDSELRSVVLDCKNHAEVTVLKQNGGGIVGRTTLGLIKNCLNTGTLEGSSATYLGGITGRSTGFIRSCSAKCSITGKTYVGGIAGDADILTDCRSMVQLSGGEKTGALLGYANSWEEISGNYYLSLDADPGAIDGISYAGIAQGLDTEAFLALPGLNGIFQRLCIQFCFADGSIVSRYVQPGKALSPDAIPALPEMDGHTAVWEGLEDLSYTFDAVITAVYSPFTRVIQSAPRQGSTRPVLLAEGSFGPDSILTAETCAASPVLEKNQTLAECLRITLPADAPVILRYLPPEGSTVDVLLVQDADGSWNPVSYTADGSYLVFQASGASVNLAAVQTAHTPWLWYSLAGVLLLGILLTLLLVRKKQKRGASAK